MLREMDSRELTEWQIYEKLEPFGEWRSDLRMAVIASILANSNRDTKQKPQPYKPQDFMLKFDQELDEDGEVVQQHRGQSPEDMLAVFRGIVEQFNARPDPPGLEPAVPVESTAEQVVATPDPSLVATNGKAAE